jgi:hypothetical protein
MICRVARMKPVSYRNVKYACNEIHLINKTVKHIYLWA